MKCVLSSTVVSDIYKVVTYSNKWNANGHKRFVYQEPTVGISL